MDITQARMGAELPIVMSKRKKGGHDKLSDFGISRPHRALVDALSAVSSLALITVLPWNTASAQSTPGNSWHTSAQAPNIRGNRRYRKLHHPQWLRSADAGVSYVRRINSTTLQLLPISRIPLTSFRNSWGALRRARLSSTSLVELRGANEMNLRGLGTGRALALLDGKRMIFASLSSGYTGADVNSVPNGLVARVDVVTGGVSAAYGSDALSGVVNFVLDHEFVGVKGNVEGGCQPLAGDDRQYTISLAAGTAFSDRQRSSAYFGEDADNYGVQGTTQPLECRRRLSHLSIQIGPRQMANLITSWGSQIGLDHWRASGI